MHNFDVSSFYAAWTRLIVDEEKQGQVADTVPYRWGNIPGDPAWSAALPILLNNMLRYYGNIGAISENYGDVKAYTDYLGSRANGGIHSMFSTYGLNK